MKDFLVIANMNAITYKEFFPLIKEGIVRPGYKNFFGGMDFYAAPEMKEVNVSGCIWFTTLPTPGRKKLVLTKRYTPEEYPVYDNYKAINVDKVKDIPYDYDGVMGVPISVFNYDLDCFEIVDARDYTDDDRLKNKKIMLVKDKDGIVAGKRVYPRILIRRKQL